MAARVDAGGQLLVRNAGDRRFAGRVDRRDDDGIGVIEAGGEIVEEIAEARVAVRLYNGDNVAPGRLPRGAEDRGDLYRVVAVVVDDGDARDDARAREAALDAGEALEALADRLGRYLELICDGYSGGRVEGIVLARHRQLQAFDAKMCEPDAIADF